jgi:hypothetical protein
VRVPFDLPAATATLRGADGAVKTGTGVNPATLVFKSRVEVDERVVKKFDEYEFNAVCTTAGDFKPLESSSAAAPATCGEAIDVPLIVRIAELLPIQAEVMSTPGAEISTQLPVLLKVASASLLSVAPTVIAAGTRAGE